MNKNTLVAIILGLTVLGVYLANRNHTDEAAEANSSVPLDVVYTPALAQAVDPLTMADKNIVTAPGNDRLFILLDLFPHKLHLENIEPAAARSLIIATAMDQVGSYLSLEENSDFTLAEVIVAYVENMDEYNRADFAGMVRFGSLVFERAGTDVGEIVENNLVFGEEI